METKKCGRCKEIKPLAEFYPIKKGGYRTRCKICSKAESREYQSNKEYLAKRAKNYYGRPEIKKKISSYYKKYRQRPYVKIKSFARAYINHAIRDGRLNKEPCAFCGVSQAEAHHLDYNEPLLIVWLCPSCHRRLHDRIKEIEEMEK